MNSYPSFLRASPQLNSIRFPAKAAMQLLTMLFVLFLSLCLFPNLATAASPQIYDVPQAGPPGSQTTTLGNGWDPNATLDIYFDSTDVGLVDTDNNGSFGMALRAPTIRQNGLAIQIPKDAVPGQHWITAVERITQLQAQVAFTVRTDWAQFHFAPDHTGFNPYENVLNPETVGNLTTHWQYTTGGYVNSSPTVANGMVYIGGDVYDNNFYALDAGTGALLWKYPAPTTYDKSVPAVANGVVYFSSEDYFYALNATTGALLWRYGLRSGTSPAVVNGVVYVASDDNPDNNVYALKANTGALIWKYTISARIFGSLAVADGVVYVGTQDRNVYALDAGTGALLWTFATQYVIDSSPAVANGIVYIASGDRYVYALAASTGTLIWKHATNAEIVSSPAVANGVVYVGSEDHNVYALNASTGALLWEYETGSAILYSAPAVANGVVYIASQDGYVYALAASTGALIWKYPIGNPLACSPAAVNGMVYVGCSGDLYAFGLPNQQMSEKFSPPQRPDPARLTPNWSPQPNSPVIPPLKK